MKTKISIWTVWKDTLQEDWKGFFIRKVFLIGRAYFKLYWALIFTNNEESSLLFMDAFAMYVMNEAQRTKYSLFLTKTRNRIGRHENKMKEWVDLEFELSKRTKHYQL